MRSGPENRARQFAIFQRVDGFRRETPTCDSPLKLGGIAPGDWWECWGIAQAQADAYRTGSPATYSLTPQDHHGRFRSRNLLFTTRLVEGGPARPRECGVVEFPPGNRRRTGGQRP